MAEDLSRFHGLTRSQLMSRIRSRGNKKTEVVLVQFFRKHRITGWQRHYPLIGTPDFIFRQHKVAIFVDGCFWHGCKRHFKMPSHRIEFWRLKIERNQLRDKKVGRLLRKAGWKVLRIWEHDLQKKNSSALLQKISAVVHV
jgi:DNA mismatch endonuclease (patch repair protein)